MISLCAVRVDVEGEGYRYSVIVVVWLPFVVDVEAECRSTRQQAGARPGLTTGSHAGMQSVTHWTVKAMGEVWWGDENGRFRRILTTAPSSHFGNVVLSVTRKKTVFFTIKVDYKPISGFHKNMVG